MKSHKHYRKSAICLNCGYTVEKKFCSNCGQENIELKEPFWILFGEGISDFFHFDSRFFKSFTAFFFKPGFLTCEYLEGRRVRYINPVRLYFFVSILLLFFSSYIFSKFNYGKISSYFEKDQRNERNELSTKLRYWKSAPVSSTVKNKKLDSLKKLIASSDSLNFTMFQNSDSLNASAQGAEYKLHRSKKEILGEHGVLYHAMEEFATHKLKVVLILLVPVFAFYLKLLYFRRNMFFQEHLIVMLYLQSFLVFFISLVYFLRYYLPESWRAALVPIPLICVVYIFFTLRKVYSQNYFRTFYKTILFLGLSGITFFLACLGAFILDFISQVNAPL